MKSLQELLKDADPLKNEPPRSDTDAQRMRRVVMTTDGVAASPSSGWRPIRGAALAAAVAVIVMVGIDRWPTQTEQTAAVTTEPSEQSASRRQVQFGTGGADPVSW